MAADSFWDMEYLFDYAVARGLSLLRPAVDSAPENQLVKIFRANAAVDNCLLVAAGLMFGDIYLGFWLAQQPILSLPSIVFYGSAGLAFIAWESTVTTDPGAIPESFARDDNGRPRFEADINELALVPSNGPRGLILITKEQKFKPKRSHFCRQMDRYILRMDHYCAFMSNCIGYKNHKFFYLFLFYSSMATSVEAFAILSQIWQVHPVAQILLLPGATLSGFLSAFSLSYCGFHSYLMCKNLTMVEFAYPKKRRQAYDEGLCRNLAQVLGDCWLFWLSPFTGPDGTGVEWGIEEEDVPEDSTKFLQIQQDCNVFISELKPGRTPADALKIDDDRQAYLLCVEGSVQLIDGQGKVHEMKQHDGSELKGPLELAPEAGAQGAFLLLFEMPKTSDGRGDF